MSEQEKQLQDLYKSAFARWLLRRRGSSALRSKRKAGSGGNRQGTPARRKTVGR